MYHENEIEQRPWGRFKVLLTGPLFTCKVLLVKPHQSISLQTHNYRAEHWIICAGIATIQLGRTIFEAGPNKYIFIEKKQPHCLANNTDDGVIVVEVQYGDHLEETDINRFMHTIRWPIQ